MDDEDEGDAEAEDGREDLELQALLQTDEGEGRTEEDADAESGGQDGTRSRVEDSVRCGGLYHA